MAVFQALSENARRVYRNMSVTQRLTIIMVGLTAAMSLGLMVFVGSITQERGKVPLPIDVPAGDYDEIAATLDEAGIDPEYDLRNQRILVPIDQRGAATMALARNDLFDQGTPTGFEAMLQQMDYSLTTETRRDMMRVALQNELATMITSIEGIERASVVYAEGIKRVLGTPVKPRASVKVTTRRGYTLTRDTADTIIALVSAAKAALDPQDVVVVDQEARHFYARAEDSVSDAAIERQTIERQVEEEARAKVEELVRAFKPGAEAFVFVNQVLDLDERKTDTREVLEGQIQRQIESQREASSVEGPQNEVGTNPNVAQLTPPAGGGTRTQESSEASDTTFALGEKNSLHYQAPGKTEQMSVSVVMHMPPVYETTEDGFRRLDEETQLPIPTSESQPPLDTDETDALKRSIANAVGLASVRDVELRQVPWNLSRADAKPPTDVGFLLRRAALKHFAVILLAVMLLGVVLAISLQVRRVIPPEEAPPEEEAEEEAPGFEEATEEQRANLQFEQMRNKVAEVVAEDPDKAASLVRRWLVSE